MQPVNIARRILPRPVKQFLKRLYAKGSLLAYPKRTVEHFYGGHRLKVRIADESANSWYNQN